MSKKLLTLLMMMLLVPMLSACGDDEKSPQAGDSCDIDVDTSVCVKGTLLKCSYGEYGYRWEAYTCVTGAYCQTIYDKAACYYACSESNQQCPDNFACNKTKNGYFCL